MVSESGSEAGSPQSRSSRGSRPSRNGEERDSPSSEGHNARWKTRLRFDVDTSGDVGMWTTSEKRTNGHEKRSPVLKEEMNSFRGSERNLSDDSRRNSPSPAVSGAQSDSDRRSVLSSVEGESSDRYDEEEDVLPTTSKPTERSKQATRCKHQGESDVEKPRTYRRKRSRTSSSSKSELDSRSPSQSYRRRSPERQRVRNNRRDRLTDEVSPRRRRSPNWKRRRHSQSRKGRSPSEQRCSRSRSGQRSHSRQRRERSREERHRRDAHRNERSRTRSVDRAVTDHRRKDGDQRTQRRVDVQSRSRSPIEKVTRYDAKSRFARKRLNGDEEGGREQQTKMSQAAREDAMWAERREERGRRGERGVRNIWGASPLMHEIHAVYEEYERMEAEQERIAREGEEKSRRKAAEVSEKKDKPKKEKTKKKSKKHKKKKKKKTSDSSESEEEWVEVTKEMREAEAAKEKLEEASMIGPAIPEHLLEKQAALIDHTKHVNYGKDMLRGEAAAMAAYIAQGKRIPRRGEIGLSSAEISEFEKIGYVMSGTRHKSMEATRLRKENQVMTAEEKRLLSGFTHDERKKKEEIVLQQFRSFIESKKAKN
uniref:NF-kappa-B-activating protein C-terminal domain-containing protein n=1 Tax=Ascaris suum TaxID=6253 RepID=F1L0J2_ASCSU